MKRNGVVAVEAALILPVFLIFALGLMEIGWKNRVQLKLDTATEVGAKSAAHGYNTNDVRQRVENILKPWEVTVETNWSASNGEDDFPLPVLDLLDQNAVEPGKMIRVTTRMTYPRLTNFFPFLRNLEMKSSSEAVRQK